MHLVNCLTHIPLCGPHAYKQTFINSKHFRLQICTYCCSIICGISVQVISCPTKPTVFKKTHKYRQHCLILCKCTFYRHKWSRIFYPIPRVCSWWLGPATTHLKMATIFSRQSIQNHLSLCRYFIFMLNFLSVVATTILNLGIFFST